jgi:hypothetical protein
MPPLSVSSLSSVSGNLGGGSGYGNTPVPPTNRFQGSDAFTSNYSSPVSLVPFLPMKSSEATFHHSSFVYCCKFHPKFG